MAKRKKTVLQKKKRRSDCERNQRAFLASYSEHGIIAQAIRDAGVARVQLTRWLEDSDFENQFNEAHDAACEAIEAEIRRRGELGYVETEKDGKGKVIRTRHKYSDRLLEFRAKAYMRDKYGDRTDIDVTSGGVGVGNLFDAINRKTKGKSK